MTPGTDVDHGRAQSRLTVLLAAAAPSGLEPVSGIEWRLDVGGTRREGKLADYAANRLEDYLEIDLTAATPVAVRYELRNDTLVEVDRADGTAALRALRPFASEFRPAELV